MNRSRNETLARLADSIRHVNDSLAILDRRRLYFLNKNYLQPSLTAQDLSINSSKYIEECRNEFCSYYERPAKHVVSLAEEVGGTPGCPEEVKENVALTIKGISKSIDELWKEINRRIVGGYRSKHHQLTGKLPIIPKP